MVVRGRSLPNIVDSVGLLLCRVLVVYLARLAFLEGAQRNGGCIVLGTRGIVLEETLVSLTRILTQGLRESARRHRTIRSRQIFPVRCICAR